MGLSLTQEVESNLATDAVDVEGAKNGFGETKAQDVDYGKWR